MKVVILAGGLGTRIFEESHLRPKPMIEIGGRPILWHIMKLYSAHGFNDFIVCLGYRGYMIKEYFSNYHMHHSDCTIDVSNGTVTYLEVRAEPWRVTLVDTGAETMTGGRLRRMRHYLTPGESFFFTYGDGLSNVNIREQLDFHKKHGRQATVTAVVPPGRYGAIQLDGERVERFVEKPPGDNAIINGGFFVLEPVVVERIAEDKTSFEREPLEGLARDGQLMAYSHTGFWHAMDTLRDKMLLEAMWSEGRAPWKSWQ